MTNFIAASNFPIDTRLINLSSLTYASVTVANTETIRASFSSSIYVDFFGSYSYDRQGNLLGGTLNRIVEIYGNQTAYEINNFSLNVAVFIGWAATGANETAKRSLFSGDDIVIGSDFGDYMEYYGGSDFFNGREGTDTVILSRAGSYTSNQLASVREGDVWRVIMPNGEITLQSVERIQVNSYTTVTPESLSFDGLAYLAVNTDVLSAVGVDPSAAARHYVRNGRREGRATSGFDAMRYLAANADLGAAFGPDTGAALMHYLHNGYSEGRSASFDAARYMASNPDLIAAFGANLTAGIQHYIEHGRLEGRSTTSFDPASYLAANADLGAAFGADTGAALMHYLHNGHSEGRSASFDAARYMASNPDLIAAFGANLTAGIQHYIERGRLEGRSTTSFDPASYLAANADISSAGYTIANAASHFLTNGWREGRPLTAPARTSMEFGFAIGG